MSAKNKKVSTGKSSYFPKPTKELKKLVARTVTVNDTGKVEVVSTDHISLASYLNTYLEINPKAQKYVLMFAHGKLYKDAPRSALVVRKSDKSLMHHGLFNLPGGKVMENETPSAAALRELKEETGQQGSFPILIGAIVNGPMDYESPSFVVYIYRCTLDPNQPPLSFEEGQPASWQPIDTCLNGHFVPNAPAILAFCAASLEGFLIQDIHWNTGPLCRASVTFFHSTFDYHEHLLIDKPPKKKRFET